MNKLRDNFCVFILTHGRPDNQKTLKTLEKCGYDGPTFLVIDDEDETSNDYFSKYGNQVVQFSKDEIAKTFDPADNFTDRRTIIYARNACFEIAKSKGYDYFLQLDDDYTSFGFRYEDNGKLKQTSPKDIKPVFEAFLQFLDETNVDTIAFAQGGDYIGGINGGVFYQGLKRKAMNSFFFKTECDLRFVGRINEDVNTYCWHGSRGRLLFTFTKFYLNQETTQKAKGGMSDVYLDSGTYLKSFYSVIFCPSSVRIGLMGNKDMRLHHKIDWNTTVPKILNEKWKKND